MLFHPIIVKFKINIYNNIAYKIIKQNKKHIQHKNQPIGGKISQKWKKYLNVSFSLVKELLKKCAPKNQIKTPNDIFVYIEKSNI